MEKPTEAKPQTLLQLRSLIAALAVLVVGSWAAILYEQRCRHASELAHQKLLFEADEKIVRLEGKIKELHALQDAEKVDHGKLHSEVLGSAVIALATDHRLWVLNMKLAALLSKDQKTRETVSRAICEDLTQRMRAMETIERDIEGVPLGDATRSMVDTIIAQQRMVATMCPKDDAQAAPGTPAPSGTLSPQTPPQTP